MIIVGKNILRNFPLKSSCRFFANTSVSLNKRIPLITCKNKQFDLYLGDKRKHVDNSDEIALASKNWQHYKAKGDHFTIHPTRSPQDVLAGGEKFSEFELDEKLVKNLDEKHDITIATKIQVDCMKEIFNNQHVLLAAETGCGKTHAFLVPIIQKVLELKREEQDVQFQRKFNSPLVLILTPARELAEQIGRMAEELCDGLNINVKVTVGGKIKRKIMDPKFEDMDILVGSIGGISKLTTTGIYRMDRIKFVVLDESDTLLDESFHLKMSYFLRRFNFVRNTQLILASATMPTSLEEFQTIIDPESLRHVVSDDLHKILPYVTQKFIRMNKTGRPEHLLRIVKGEVEKRRPCIVFANKTATCDYVSIFLNNNGVDCININGDMQNDIRAGRFDQFRTGAVNVLSTTDCMGRGINTLRARHIINFDFPMFIADYIHRCGRIGRLGGVENCTVTNFISSQAELHLVRKIELSARTDHMLKNVDANIGKIYKIRVEKEMEKVERDLLKQQAESL